MVFKKYLSIIAVLCIGSLLSAVVFISARDMEYRSIEMNFAKTVQGQFDAVSNNLTDYAESLDILSDFYATQTTVSYQNFRTFTSPILHRHKAIKSLAWIPLVDHKQREAMEDYAKTYYFIYNFTEYVPEKNYITAQKRDNYLPVYYLVPNLNNDKYLGFDFASYPDALKTLNKSRDHGGKVIMTQLPQLQHDSKTDIIIFYPIYKQEFPKYNSAQRRTALQGFVAGTFHLTEILKEAIHKTPLIDFEFILKDITDVKNHFSLYRHVTEAQFSSSESIQKKIIKKSIMIADREWQLTFKLLNPYSFFGNTWQPRAVLIMGISLTLLISLYLLNMVRRSEALQREIEERQNIEGMLVQRDKEFREFVNVAPVMLWMTDPIGQCLLLNQTWQKFTGADLANENFTEKWTNSIHPDDLMICLEVYTEAFFEKHDNFTMTYRVQRHDGEYRWISENSIARFNEYGEFMGFIGAGIDITEQKRMEEELRVHEEQFRTFVNFAPVMLWMSDEVGKCTLFNQTWLDFTGRSLEEELQAKWGETIHPDDIERCTNIYDVAFKTHQGFKLIYRFYRHDGEYRWISETTSARFDVNQNFLGFIGACTDITEQKNAQKALNDSQRRLTTLMRNLPGMAYRCANDGQWSMVFASEGCYSLLEYTPHDIMNRKVLYIRDIVHPEDKHYVWKNIKQALKEQRAYTQTYRIFTASGSLKWVWEQGQGVFNEQNELETLEGFVADITEQKQNEEALNDAKEMAETANIAKSQFLANMSHELRTPLNAILGYTEILQEDVDELNYENCTVDLEKIYTSAKHLLNLINDILDISKIEAGRVQLEIQKCALAPIVNSIYETIQPVAQTRSNKVILDCASNLGDAYIDEEKIRQVLLNLLGNAAKFTSDGHIFFTIKREEIADLTWLVFTIKDTGIGITPEQRQHLFKTFNQADNSPTREYGGTGLGLAITYNLIQMMHGEITVDSVFNEGSIFTIRIPSKQPTDSEQLLN